MIAGRDRAPALEVAGLGRRFGGFHALRGVSLRVERGERRAILGPNGAGKTTLFNLLSGELEPTEGAILLFGEDVTRLSPHARARRGLGRTYQTAHLFAELTVREHLFLAARGSGQRRTSLFAALAERPDWARADAMAERVGLSAERGTPAAALSHGQQRQLEIGMALAGGPRQLLLDEPAAGLSPGERGRLLELLSELEPDMTVLLIEHDMDIALEFASVVTILHQGQTVVTGSPEEIQASEEVHALYLGAVHG
ncbi:ABC transporter ATP-binding protein [Sorangium sp. So ce341]|uniref:ABC transporter ATP-binding protein n=1 Tax=Sorangium sp. So ce341 TaxID=3133302 RepID=UPI003F60A751